MSAQWMDLPSDDAEYSDLHLHSKGFLPEIEVQDFPIRGKAVYLRIKRRRWDCLLYTSRCV